MQMQRTQISLEPEQHRLLDIEARRQGVSLAAIVRQLINEHLQRDGIKKAELLDSITGIGSDPTKGVAKHHDRYLYGIDG